jgi:hypothetical protein
MFIYKKILIKSIAIFFITFYTQILFGAKSDDQIKDDVKININTRLSKVPFSSDVENKKEIMKNVVKNFKKCQSPNNLNSVYKKKLKILIDKAKNKIEVNRFIDQMFVDKIDESLKISDKWSFVNNFCDISYNVLSVLTPVFAFAATDSNNKKESNMVLSFIAGFTGAFCITLKKISKYAIERMESIEEEINYLLTSKGIEDISLVIFKGESFKEEDEEEID